MSSSRTRRLSESLTRRWSSQLLPRSGLPPRQSAEKRLNFSDENVSYSDDLPEFFKIYKPCLSSGTMRIPPDFMDKFDGNIPTTVKLKMPWGVCRQVDMKRMDECWYLEKGWPEFVQENSLDDGDFMTFCFVGKSTFCVKIFSPNGCAKGGRGRGGGEDTSDESCESENSEMIVQ